MATPTMFGLVSAVAASTRPRVCIVGAGAGGLVAARLLRDVADVVVFERAATVGGIWRPGAPVLYEGLVTNLPKQIMAYRDAPFPSEWNSFVTAAQVGEYLRRYCDQHQLWDCVKLRTPVQRVKLLSERAQCGESGEESGEERGADDSSSSDAHADQWEVRYGADDADETPTSQTFDAVIVANGHYETPSYASLPGADKFPHRIMHSAEYDTPHPFAGQTVLCIGARSSGTDLAREISAHAARTLTADKACAAREESGASTGLFRTPPVEMLRPDGSVLFADGTVEPCVNVIIHCVGYEYSFPFLNGQSGESGIELDVGERRVSPLYEHLFHAGACLTGTTPCQPPPHPLRRPPPTPRRRRPNPRSSPPNPRRPPPPPPLDHPSLAFLGIPHSVVPFPLMEVQSALLAKVLSGRVSLPPRAERHAALAARDAALTRPKDAHHLGGAQWDYCRRLLALGQIADRGWQRHIQTNEAVYNDVGPRRPPFPGGDDGYRRLEYTVDHTSGEWKCSESPCAAS